MLKLGTQPREWLAQNEQIFREKWGWTPSPTLIFRSLSNGETWHYCSNCPDWPDQHYDEQPEIPEGPQCAHYRSLWDTGECRLGSVGTD
jgi:hypothetical protein